MRRFFVFSGIILLLWGCGGQRAAQSSKSTRRPAVWDDRPAAQVQTPSQAMPEVLMPEARTPQEQGPLVRVITSTGADMPVTVSEEEFVMNVQFSPAETQHVRMVLSDPRPGDMLVLPLGQIGRRFCYPCDGEVISAYGKRGGGMHTGVDIKPRPGDTIRAALPGVVRMSKEYSNYGNIVVIRHPCGLETLYGHNSRNLVKVNDRVTQGQAIAIVGRTGRATTEHLHFEMRAAGEHFDPSLIVDHKNRTARADTIYIYNKGTALMVFNSASAREFFAAEKPAAAPVATAPEEHTAPGASPASRPRALTSPEGTTLYTVVKGDALTRIAAQYNTSVAQICYWNGIRSEDMLSVGQRLIVAGGGDKAGVPAVPAKPQPVSAPANASAAPAVPAPRTPGERPEYHVVARGETLSGIAASCGMSLDELCRLNDIANPDQIGAGQRLRLRGDAPAPASPAPRPAVSVAATDPAAAPNGRVHTVAKGETLYRISLTYKTTVARICEMNAIEEGAILREGQQLRMP